jgi:DNA-binding NarL/FixJ family response regulator
MSPPIRVLLVDDHAMMRAGFRTILEADGGFEVVGEAGSGTEAVARAAELHPDVVCMDVQMPGMDGLEATRRIVADPDSRAAVLVVTTFDRDDYLFTALEAGASGFLLKNAGPEQLVDAVRVVAAGDALLAPEVTRRVIARFATQSAVMGSARPAPDDPRTADGSVGAPAMTGRHEVTGLDGLGLTDRETEVLRLMSDALSNAEIAARLFIGEATVKTHVSNVLQKLGARDRVQAVVLAHRRGLA